MVSSNILSSYLLFHLFLELFHFPVSQLHVLLLIQEFGALTHIPPLVFLSNFPLCLSHHFQLRFRLYPLYFSSFASPKALFTQYAFHVNTRLVGTSWNFFYEHVTIYKTRIQRTTRVLMQTWYHHTHAFPCTISKNFIFLNFMTDDLSWDNFNTYL